MVLMYLLGRILNLLLNKFREYLWTKWPLKYNYLRLELAALKEDENERQRALKARAEAALRVIGIKTYANLNKVNSENGTSISANLKKLFLAESKSSTDSRSRSISTNSPINYVTTVNNSNGISPQIKYENNAQFFNHQNEIAEIDVSSEPITPPDLPLCCRGRHCRRCSMGCYFCTRRVISVIRDFFHHQVVGSMTAREAMVPVLCSLTISLLVLYAFLVSYLLLPQVQIIYSPSP